ncbi:AsmA-like C-terminal region-containing protein [Gemmatimonadota bacterium]
MARRRSERTASRWIRWVLFGTVVVCGLYLALAFVSSRFLDPEALADWLEPRLEAAVHRDVEIGRVEVRLLPLAVGVREVALADPTGLAPALARVGSLDLRLEILPLLRRNVKVKSLVLDGVEANLLVGPTGLSNFGDLSPTAADTPPGAEGPADRPFSLDLKTIRLSGGQLRYSNEEDSVSVVVQGLKGRASVRKTSEGAWSLVGSSQGDLTVHRGPKDPYVGARIGRRTLIEDLPFELSATMEADADLQDLRIDQGQVRLDRSSLEFAGDVMELRDPVRRVSLDLSGEDLSLRALTALLPDTIQERVGGELGGILALNLHLEGEVGPETAPKLGGQVNLSGGELTSRAGGTLFETLEGAVNLSEDGTAELALQGRALYGPVSVEGTLSLGEGATFDLTLEGNPNLSGLTELMKFPEGVTVTGRMQTRARVRGAFDNLPGVRLSGEVFPSRLRVTHPSLGVAAEVPEGRIQLAGRGVNFQGLPLFLGEDRLLVTGELPEVMAFLRPERVPEIRLTLRGPRLNLVRLSSKAPPDPALTYGKVAFAKVGGRPVVGRTPEQAARELGLSRPDSLPFAGRGEIIVDTLIDRKGRSEGVRARFEFGPSFVRVTDAAFRRFGGDLRTAGSLFLDPRRDGPFSFSLQVTDLDAGSFLAATTPLGNLVHGRISLNVDVIGSLDDLLLPDRTSLVGSGHFSLTDGGLRQIPVTEGLSSFLGLGSLREPNIQSWQTSFLMENGAIRLAEAVLTGAPGEPRLGGSVGLDGSLDLLSAFDLPVEGLEARVVDRLRLSPALLEGLRARGEAVRAAVLVGGFLFSPEIRAAVTAPGQTLTQTVREEVQAEAQQRIEEQKRELQERATGFLRGLIRERAPAGPPLPDTLRGDSIPPDTTGIDSIHGDTAAADSLRPDTVLPDTMHPDTIRPDTMRPDTVLPDTVPSDTLPPDTLPPDTLRPDTLRPDTLRPVPLHAQHGATGTLRPVLVSRGGFGR